MPNFERRTQVGCSGLRVSKRERYIRSKVYAWLAKPLPLIEGRDEVPSKCEGEGRSEARSLLTLQGASFGHYSHSRSSY